MDTGWDRESEAQASLDYGRGVGRPNLNGIVVTRRHPPHWGHALAIHRVTGAPIIATAVKRAATEERMAGAGVDRVVEDGETLRLDSVTVEFLHGPGHTYGSRFRQQTERAVRLRQRHGHGHVRDQPRRRWQNSMPSGFSTAISADRQEALAQAVSNVGQRM